jgi:calcium-dependent protein kinase
LGKTKTPVGSKPYAAIEVYKRSGHDTRADIWSAGAVIFSMVTGTLAFPYGPVSAKALTHPHWHLVKDEILKDLLKAMLNRDPQKRPTATKALQHAYFTGVS